MTGATPGGPRLAALWQGWQPRERRAVGLALAVVTAALLWWVALQPALTTLRQADARHTQLQAQLATMQALADQARQLKAQPALGRDERLRALEAATTQHLGPQGRLAVVGEQVTVTLNAVPPQALALWLGDLRVNARLTATEARLTRVGAAWQGSVGFSLGG